MLPFLDVSLTANTLFCACDTRRRVPLQQQKVQQVPRRRQDVKQRQVWGWAGCRNCRQPTGQPDPHVCTASGLTLVPLLTTQWLALCSRSGVGREGKSHNHYVNTSNQTGHYFSYFMLSRNQAHVSLQQKKAQTLSRDTDTAIKLPFHAPSLSLVASQ